MKSRCTTVLEN